MTLPNGGWTTQRLPSPSTAVEIKRNLFKQKALGFQEHCLRRTATFGGKWIGSERIGDIASV
jgi:hypothetical protein